MDAAKNPYGRLGELAGFSGPPATWRTRTRNRLDDLYGNDPDRMAITVQRLAVAEYGGIEGAAPRLEDARRDYAAYWLLRQMDGTPLPPVDQQFDAWKVALASSPDRQLPLTLAVAGFDIVTPLVDGDTHVLTAFTFSAHASELAEFISLIPPDRRVGHLNMQNDEGMSCAHIAAFASGPGCLTVLKENGCNLAALMQVPSARLGVLKANAAHLSVMNGRPDLTAELMALDRNLFTRSDPEIRYAPHELVLEVAHDVPGGPRKEVKMAANISAFAVDAPMPFAEVGWVLNKLGPMTAPRPPISRNQLN